MRPGPAIGEMPAFASLVCGLTICRASLHNARAATTTAFRLSSNSHSTCQPRPMAKHHKPNPTLITAARLEEAARLLRAIAAADEQAATPPAPATAGPSVAHGAAGAAGSAATADSEQPGHATPPAHKKPGPPKGSKKNSSVAQQRSEKLPRGEKRRRVIAALQASPNASVADIARQMKVASSYVSEIKRGLQDDQKPSLAIAATG